MIIDNIKHTRSHRRFTEKSIKEEEILEMLEGARFSASTKKCSNFKIFLYNRWWKMPKIIFYCFFRRTFKNEDKATLEERARGFILISAKKDITTPDSRLFFDVGIASQNIILIADELGYGACIVMSYNKKAFEEILDLPEDYDSKAVIILGEAKDIVKLVDSKDEEDTKYFIENGIHHVPKLKLGDLILAKK